MKTTTTITRLLLVVLLAAALAGMAGQPFHAQAEPRSKLGSPAYQAALAAGPVYDWHTFYGVSEGSLGMLDLAVDADGNVYLAGSSTASWGNPLHAYSGGQDILVVKLDSQGEYLWHTYFGAAPNTEEAGIDEGQGIAVDAAGNVYVTGYSDLTWQGPVDAEPLNAHAGDGENMFVLKINSGGAYQWHTFFQPGRANAVALDSSGVYITGYASASWGTPKHAFTGNLVVFKVDPSGEYQWHTYYGAMAPPGLIESGNGLGVDTDRGMVYMTGSSWDPWVGDGNVEPLHPFSGASGELEEIVVLKLDTSGNYQWHTFYGARDQGDAGHGIAIDGQGNPYICGYSIMGWGNPLHEHSTVGDVTEADFTVLKLNPAGEYQWHTFYGSPGTDLSGVLAVDSGGSVYITGFSSDPWLGDQNSGPEHAFVGMGDIAVLKLNASGSYQWHTFYGSGGIDVGTAITLDSRRSVIIAGISRATWQGDGGISPINPHSGAADGDGFVLKLNDQEPLPLFLPLVVR
jgi:hypothetical protein